MTVPLITEGEFDSFALAERGNSETKGYGNDDQRDGHAKKNGGAWETDREWARSTRDRRSFGHLVIIAQSFPIATRPA